MLALRRKYQPPYNSLGMRRQESAALNIPPSMGRKESDGDNPTNIDLASPTDHTRFPYGSIVGQSVRIIALGPFALFFSVLIIFFFLEHL